MLVEKINQIANEKGFVFKIGDEHWQNLLDAADDSNLPFEQRKKYLMLFSEKENRTYGEISVKEDVRSCIFLLAVRSKISDPSFEYKYENHIAPLKELAREIEDNDFSICDDFTLKSFSIDNWKENYYDTNLDCVEVRITAEYNG